tara:strand:- start:226 stop:2277 length:2052 start_codon:yes stop_codon:yes gene_type:complete
MKKKPTVYISDLRHVADGLISNTCMPLGTGYMKAVMDRDLPEVESRLFTYPDQLLEAMKSDTPDVLMLTNYVWNEQLARYFTNVAKRMHQNTLVVAGGPNIPPDTKGEIDFFDSWKDLDVYALGEGDFLATEIVSRFLDVNKSITKFLNGGVPSSLYRTEGETVRRPLWKRELELEKIPSPWLSGVQDHFFDGKLIPMVETNRGCPFKCTFCAQGTGYYSRVVHFEEDQVKEELNYIVRRLKKICPQMGALTIADPNFGMYKRDVDISAYIGTLQKNYGWPTFIDCSTGKNSPELIIKAIENTNGAMSMLHAVQSLDNNVLESIKRSNIKLDTYEKVTEHLIDKGISTNSQIILGLPKETLQTHLTGLHRLVDLGINNLQNFQLMLLKGSEIASQESRNEFGFKIKFRLSPRCFGTYGGKTVFDLEEIVVATKSLSFDAYIHARKHHLGYMVFWSQTWFKDLFSFAQNVGIKNSTCMKAIVEEMNSYDGPIHRFMLEFIEETKGELFSTPEECFKYYAEDKRFEKLVSGELGDNLLNKYRATASFLIWPEICKLATRVVKKLIKINGSNSLDSDFELFWEDLSRYVEYSHACGQSLDDILLPVSCSLQYDISRWVADGWPKTLSLYKLETPKTFLFKLSESGAKEIHDAIETWSVDLRGLTKVARYLKRTSQVRQPVLSSFPR